LPKRAALLAAIKPGDTVITPKLDRMFRSARDALGVLADLKKRGIALQMIDLGGDMSTNGVSKLVFTILSAKAERDSTRERIAEVKRDQRTRGRYLGGKAPFGWKVADDSELVAVPEQQAALARMRTLRAAGLSYRAIAQIAAAGGRSATWASKNACLQRPARRPVRSPRSEPAAEMAFERPTAGRQAF
jgi:putative DNA-invertase from lambdoid prophage Rac